MAPLLGLEIPGIKAAAFSKQTDMEHVDPPELACPDTLMMLLNLLDEFSRNAPLRKN
jgi:hypothetical protein